MPSAFDSVPPSVQSALAGDQLSEWPFLAQSWDAPPALAKSITGGSVYEYTLGGVTRYRFVPSPYDAAQDAFYQAFDSSTESLSQKITSRAG